MGPDGLLKDGKMKRSPRLRLDVTEELIQKAVPKDSKHCMIAEAVKIAFPSASAIAVDLATIRFSDRKKRFRYTYLTPRIAQAALVNFDQERAPEPFSFTLRGAQITNLDRAPKNSNADTPSEASEGRTEALKKARLVFRKGREAGNVPDRVGGQAPPL